MPAFRCETHEINFPFVPTYFRCPICDEANMRLEDGEPDDEWDFLLALHLELEQQDPITEPELDIETLSCRVIEDKGGLWLHSWDAYHGGLHSRALRLEPHELFQIEDTLYEILSFDQETRRYRLRRFSLTLSDEDLARLCGPSA